MPDPSAQEQRAHEITLHVFSISAGLVGVCLTAIGLLRVFTAHSNIKTIGDELLAADAMFFMICCFLSFRSFKQTDPVRLRRLRRIIDTLFMTALAMMVVICSLIAYAVI